MSRESEEPEATGGDTSSLPGYQPTERLDLAQLARVISAEETDPAVAIHEPLERAVPARPVADDDDDAPAPPPPEPAERPTSPPTPPAAPPTPPSPIEKETQEIVRRLPRPLPLVPAPERTVTVVDLPVSRVRRPGDLVAAVVTAVGCLLVLLLAVFAHNTTEAVTEDVENALPKALVDFLSAPLNIIEGVTTLWLPIAIAAAALIRRRPRQVGEATLAGAAAAGLIAAANWALDAFDAKSLISGVETAGGVAFIPIIAALAAYLTVMGTSDRRRMVTWTWNLLWLTIVLQVLQAGMTLPGALASVLIGRAIGLTMRYLGGVVGERAYGESLVAAMRRCGIDPERILRIVDGRPLEGVAPEEIVTDAPIGYVTEEPTAFEEAAREGGAAAETAAGATPREESDSSGEPGRPVESGESGDDGERGSGGDEASEDPKPAPGPVRRTREVLAQTWDFSTEIAPISDPIPTDPAAATSEPRDRPRPPVRTATAVVGEEEGENRIYSVRDVSGTVWDVGVLDGDRQVLGTLASTWNAVRLRGAARRAPVSLRAALDRASLMSYAVESAGVRTPRLRGFTLEDDSAVLVSEHVPGTQVLADVQTRRLTDDVLDAMWQELRTAHGAGIAHRNLDDQAVLLDGAGEVLLTGWAQGEISSPRLARRLDLVALLALQALRVGAERAMASAVRNLTREDLQAIAPIFQTVVLPERTRPEARKHKKVLKEVQSVLLGILPSGTEVEPVQMRRFSARTIITVTVAVVAATIVVTSINLQEMIGYVSQANPYLLALAFLLGLATYVGSAMALVAFSPEKLSLWRTTLVQVAASVVGLVAPAGVGPAALNLRYLQKNKLGTPMAVATVALVQVSQFITTVLLLLGLALVTGSSGALDGLPSGAVLIAIGATIAVVGAALFVPAVRRWAWAKIMPTARQIWPRLVWVVGQPGRLVAALVGNAVMTIGYIAAFGFTLLAFGAELPVTSLSIVYLAGNTAGALVPVPGGIGAIELALTSGLTAAGITYAIAFSTAMVFRLITFWVRIPLGWLALQHLQKRNLV